MCLNCETEYDIWKPMSECSNDETCPTCDETMLRMYTVPQINIPTGRGKYNPGLGCIDNGPETLKNINRERRDKGEPELIPVGNERPKDKPKKDPYAMSDKDMHGIKRILEKA